MKGERRCRAKAKSTGARCARPAIAGAVVCRVHGGAAPQVKRKAAERLRDLQDPAITALEDALRPTEDTRDRIRAATEVLNRTGLVPGVKLQHVGEDGGPVRVAHEDYSHDQVVAEVLGLLERQAAEHADTA